MQMDWIGDLSLHGLVEFREQPFDCYLRGRGEGSIIGSIFCLTFTAMLHEFSFVKKQGVLQGPRSGGGGNVPPNIFKIIKN